MSVFSERLAESRKAKKIKQREAAQILGVSESAYASYEHGRNTPGPAAIAKLAKFFGVSTDYLLGLSELPESNTESYTPPKLKSRLYKEEGTADRLIKLREEKKLSQEDVAKKLGVPIEEYAAYETGEIKPPSEHIIELAHIFDASTDYLLGQSDQRHMTPTIAAHTDDPNGLPPEAQDEVMQYIEFIKQKYGLEEKEE